MIRHCTYIYRGFEKSHFQKTSFNTKLKFRSVHTMAKSYRPYPEALLNPCADPTFKMLFTSENEFSRKALVSFLQTLLGKTITDVKLQPNVLSGETPYDKQAEFDITCKVDNEFANIEFQGQNDHNAYGKRAEYHVAHLLNHYTTRGTDWEDIKKVYQISLLNFTFNKTSDKPFHHYMMKNEDDQSIAEILNVFFIELPKIAELPDNIETLTEMELWGKFFLYASNANKRNFLDQICKKSGGINMAAAALSYLSDDEANWISETRYWTHVSDEKTKKNAIERMKREIENGRIEIENGRIEIENSKKELESGKRELESGKRELKSEKQKLESDKRELKSEKQELEKNRQNVLSQGVQQGKRNLLAEVVKNLCSIGTMTPDDISKITGTSVEEIQDIMASLKNIGISKNTF